MFGIPASMLWRLAPYVGCVILILAAWAWIADKDRQIERAHAETRAARLNAAHAVLYGAGRQAQVFADVASIAALRSSLDDQSAHVRELSAAGQRATQEAAEARRAALATHAADEGRLAALRRAVAAAGPDRCRRADAAAAAALEALN